jgi:hypothetical protein
MIVSFCELISIAIADRDASRSFFLRSMKRLKARSPFFATLADVCKPDRASVILLNNRRVFTFSVEGADAAMEET